MRFVQHHLSTTALLAVTLLPAAFAQSTFTSASAGNWGPIVAPGSIAAGFGANFATATTAATSLPLPISLGNATVTITDSSGAKLAAPLFMVASGQINYLVPANAALGKATVSVTAGTNIYQGILDISNVSPAIFAANNSGVGVPAAQVLRVSGSNVTLTNAFTPGLLGFVPGPFSLVPFTDKVYLILYGTGIARHSLNPVEATIGGVSVPVAYAGAQSTLSGLDQVNLGPLPSSLSGTGQVSMKIMLYVDGIVANITSIAIQ